MDYKGIIAIDFDGTISSEKYPYVGNELNGAKKVINELYNNGYYIIIWTCRSGDELVAAINWLLENDYKFHRINDHSPQMLKKFKTKSPKIYADYYIDDKNIGGFIGWAKVEEIILGKPI